MTESLFQASNTNGVASSIALKIPDPIGKERTYSTSVPSVSIPFKGESIFPNLSIALKIPDPIGKEPTYSTSVPSVSISFRGEIKSILPT